MNCKVVTQEGIQQNDYISKRLHNTRLHFLDTLVIKSKDGILFTDLYEKPTDSHKYLHYTSSHPTHCKKSVPYRQFLRIRRICIRDADYFAHASKLAGYFRQRGYPPHLIEESAEKVACMIQSELLNKRSADTENPDTRNIYAISTFHPRGNVVRKRSKPIGHSYYGPGL